ncbi:hypothetical protein [Salinimicrobium gaetbulicola]|uniref:Receptor L-domain domain-containing protein n=1 Tax=Salinimicrobium gaetbulicola TaxID=999702 RepID=A0ABW3IG26_9FLAO
MKFSFLSLFLAFFLFSCSSESPSEEPNPEPAEKYFNNHKSLTTQTEVEDFGEKGFTVITGNLIIGVETSSDPITNLSSLSSLTSVRGDIVIIGTSLEDLDGLENIDLEDDSYLSLINNPHLMEIRGLRGITGQLKQLDIRLSPKLESLAGLEGVTNVTYNLELRDLEKLNNLSALSNIQHPVEYLTLNQTGITSTTGLSNIPAVTDLSLFHNDNLISLHLAGLQQVKRFSISHNSSLENINGLTGLKEVENFNIGYNASLQNLDGLETLERPVNMSMSVSNNSSLGNFCGLQTLTSKGWTGFNAYQNLYNPTIEQVAGEECQI